MTGKNWFYFQGVKTLQDVRRQYKKLVMEFHPDKFYGDTQKMEEMERVMKLINAEYEVVFNWVKENPINDREANSSQYANANDLFRDILQKVVFVPEIDIEICGSWIWISSPSKYDQYLKSVGFAYTKGKNRYYWKPYETSKKRGKNWKMEKIREYYGSEKVKKEENDKIKKD